MSIPAAYLGVVLIWTTTPLAIQWSTQGGDFLLGVTARMVIGAVIAVTLTMLMGFGLPRHRIAIYTYIAAGSGIFGAMVMVYWSAMWIPSGWIAVVFGLAPIFTAVIAGLWLGERHLTPLKLVGMVAGVAGLAVIVWYAKQGVEGRVLGVLGVLFSVLIHSFSSVWVKRVGGEIPAWSVTAGGLLVASPLFLLVWWWFAPPFPEHLDTKTMAAIGYLSVVGSVLGFVLYYYLLRWIDATKTALIALMTPVTALWLGHVINAEPLAGEVVLGTAIIMSGLALFQYADRHQQV